jgi:subtilase family serine protease
MSRLISVAIFSAGLVCGAAANASAQAAANASARAVERSGATYHIAVCPGPAAPGDARCHARLVTDRAGNPLERAASPAITPSGYGPADLRAAYAVTGTGSATTIVAIVDAYGYPNAESDLAVYRSTYGLPACTTSNGCFTKYNQSGVQGSYPKLNTGWAQETALDLDMVSAMCPGCKIILVEASSTSLANLGAAVNTAASKGAHVISNSYGGGESGSTTYESSYNHPGVAITASSGDSGYGVQFPASSPHVTAAGGTSLVRTSSGRGWAETVWSGAGSGCSAVYAKPTWQTDPSCPNRMEADVSAVADPNTGVAVYGPSSRNGSAWQVYGGTSVAAPLLGGIYGLNGGAVNYGSSPYTNTASLNDVVSGSNGSCGGTYFCTAGPGYDGPTGLGTPKGTAAF